MRTPGNACSGEENRGWLISFLREPIVHFILLAALLFASHALLASFERETIFVSVELVADLERRQAELLGRPLSPEELTAGALGELGIPTQEIPPALLFFNVGVELGQPLRTPGARVWVLAQTSTPSPERVARAWCFVCD